MQTAVVSIRIGVLYVGRQLEVVQSQVCRTQDEVLTTGEQWKAAMIEKGWQQAKAANAASFWPQTDLFLG